MISDRYAKVISFILALVMVPTFVHSYLGAKTDDSFRAKSISNELAGLRFADTNRNAAWVQDIFDSDDWIERRSIGTDDSRKLLFVARSFDYKKLYHHPELAILYGQDLVNGGVESIIDNFPVHFLMARRGPGVVAYCLLHDKELIGNPLLFQLSTAMRSLVSSKKPMTLFLLYDPGLFSIEGFGDSQLGLVLRAAVDNFRSQ